MLLLFRPEKEVIEHYISLLLRLIYLKAAELPEYLIFINYLVQLEVDSVLLLRLPLEYLIASARVVGTSIHCKDEPIISMLEFGYQVGKDLRYLVPFVHVLHKDVD